MSAVAGGRLGRAADRYLDAARHMRASQLLARPRRLVPARVLAAGLGRAAAPGWLPAAAAAGAGVDPAPQSGPQPPPEADGWFRAAGAARRFPSPGFWTAGGDGLLFLFHLHGFAELARYAAGPRDAEGDAFWDAVIGAWLRDCDVPRRPAWHPFPTSGRLIAWSAALSAGGWPDGLQAAIVASLRRQARLVRRSVEHDIGGNHVLRNGAALAIAGICLREPATEERGLAVLRRGLARQLLADGGHEERSPSYHRAVLADLDDVAAVLERAGRPRAPWLDDAAERMRGWLAALAGPDGRLPLLNDAWEGPPLAVSTRPAEPLTDLAATGYIVLRHGGDQAILDVGPVAPPHLPPHAHADVLSFVLWADGAPLVADPGTLAYGRPDRDAFRGTAAHATVTVDGRDQCDLWGPFRAAHLPRVRRLRTERLDGAVVVAAEHDGYRRLPDPVVHRRTFCWLDGDGLVVLDRLLTRTSHRATTRLPLAPGVETDGTRLGPFTVTVLGDGPAPQVRPARHAPYLGTEVPSLAIVRDLDIAPGAVTGWALLRQGVEAQLTGDRVQISRPGRALLEVVAE